MITDNGVFKDLHVDLIEGTTYAFTTIGAGRQALSTLGGRVIARDSGRVTWTFIVDTKGTSDLDQYELLDATVDAISGPHQLFDDEDAFCAFVAEAVG